MTVHWIALGLGCEKLPKYIDNCVIVLVVKAANEVSRRVLRGAERATGCGQPVMSVV